MIAQIISIDTERAALAARNQMTDGGQAPASCRKCRCRTRRRAPFAVVERVSCGDRPIVVWSGPAAAGKSRSAGDRGPQRGGKRGDRGERQMSGTASISASCSRKTRCRVADGAEKSRSVSIGRISPACGPSALLICWRCCVFKIFATPIRRVAGGMRHRRFAWRMLAY